MAWKPFSLSSFGGKNEKNIILDYCCHHFGGQLVSYRIGNLLDSTNYQ